MKSEREYVAFISYRHKDLDKYVAKKIHTLIERYVIPKELRSAGRGDGQQAGHGRGSDQQGSAVPSKKLGFVFRDEEELPVSSNLTDSIQTALDHSKYLIVICTPNTPESIWVEREISYFLEHHDRAHVIGVLADGTPEQSFPKLLTTVYGEDGKTPIGAVEPLAANLTNNAHRFDKSRMKKEAVRLYAALLGCPFDSLWQRDRRYKMRCAMALMALGLTVALSFCLSIYLKNLQITARNQQIEEQNDRIQQQNAKIQGQNSEIRKQNEEIQEKNSELALSEADTKLREGELLYERGDMSEAAMRALEAISGKEGQEHLGSEAEYLLNRALGAGQYDNRMRTVGMLEQERDIRELAVARDRERIFTMDDRGYVRCFSAKGGEILWLGDTKSRKFHFYISDRKRMTELESGLLLCCNEDVITALDAWSGQEVWSYVPMSDIGSDFACLSPDQKTLAVITTDGLMSMENKLTVLDTESGAVKQELPMEEAYGNLRLTAYGSGNGVFSEDGRYLAGVVYDSDSFYGCDGWSVFLADLQEGTISKIYSRRINLERFQVYPFAIGMRIQPEKESVLVLHYDVDLESVCMEDITWKGKITESSKVPLTLPVRELSEPYSCTFAPGKENGAILASCAEMTLIYRQEDGALLNSRKYSTARVLDMDWMDEGSYTRAMLTDDGYLYGLYEQAGYAIGQFADLIHIEKLAISEGYAENHGGFGHSLMPDAVMTAVCDDNPRRAYILRPAKDPEVQEVTWYEDFNHEGMQYNGSLSSLDDSTLLFVETRSKEQIRVQYIDADSQKVIRTYELELPELEEFFTSSDIFRAVFWADQEHFSVQFGYRSWIIYDMKNKEVTEVFGDYKDCGSAACRGKDGDTFHVCLSVGDAKEELLLLRRNAEELRVIESTGESRWFLPGTFQRGGFLRLGDNGYVLIGQYAAGDESERMSSFLAYRWADGKMTKIEDICPGDAKRMLVLGEREPVFATADGDGIIRIYDMGKGGLVQSIEAPIELSELENVLFCAGDGALAVWSLNRELYLYEVSSGKLLWQGIFERENTASSMEVSVVCLDDSARDRVYFRTSSGAVICISTGDWKKTADFEGMDAFCPWTNEIYKLKYYHMFFREEGNGILRSRAYTLEELKEKALKK